MKKSKVFVMTFAAVIVATLLFVMLRPASIAQPARGTIATAYSVSTSTASRSAVSESFSLIGTITAFNDVTVISETQGRVVKVLAEVGDVVTAGSVLVQVDDELKQASFAMAEVTYQKAKKDLERYESIYKEGSVSDAQLEGARLAYKSAEAQFIVARRQFNDTKITTPITGIVAARSVNIGSMVMGAPQATVIANVVDISRLKVKINVPEQSVFRLKAGDPVAVTTDVFPNISFAGFISSISAKGDDAHTYPVEVLLNNTRKQLKAGMFGRVTFSPKSSGTPLVVPREAIVGSLKNARLYVVLNSVAKLRTVVTGQEYGTSVEILDGLKEGDIVVVSGQNNLKDNASVIVRK